MDVLLVEDDDGIATPLAEGLARHGMTVRRVATGAEALRAAPGDVVLLDLGLPDMDGLEVCRTLRAAGSAVPIIVLTARGEEADRVVGLELGADDYVVKPFGTRELVARIRAVHRRARGPEAVDEVHEAGGVRLDVRARRVWSAGREVELTAKEFDLLALLMEEPGRAWPRRLIHERVWGGGWYGTTRTLDQHVATLRRKLGEPELIETVRGVGYRLRVES